MSLVAGPDAAELQDAERPAAGAPLAGAFRLACTTPGALGGLALEPARRPATLGPDEVEIEVRAAALNFSDVLSALDVGGVRGLALGLECSGVVARVGAAVETAAPGDAVVAIAPGSLASHATTIAPLVAAKPPRLDFAAAATLPIAYLTAHFALLVEGRLARGERVLVHSAAGGVGLAAVALAERAGAEILATAGNEEKRALLRRRGIATVLDSRGDFAAGVRAATGGAGVDVVLSALAGDAVESGIALLAPFGRFLEIGKSLTTSGVALAGSALQRAIHFAAVDLRLLCAERPQVVRAALLDVLACVERGELPALPFTGFALADAEAGFRWMAQRRNVGKVVFLAAAAADARETCAALAPVPAARAAHALRHGRPLRRAQLGVVDALDLAAIEERCSEFTPAAATARDLGADGVAIDWVRRGDGELLARIGRGAPDEDEPLPAAATIALVLRLALPLLDDGGVSATPPLAIARVAAPGVLPARGFVHVTRTGAGQSGVTARRAVSAVIADDAGVPRLLLDGIGTATGATAAATGDDEPAPRARATLVAPPAAEAATRTTAGSGHRLQTVRWFPVAGPAAAAAATSAAPRATGRFLLLADDDGIAGHVVADLERRGHRCIVVRAGDGFAAPAPDRFTVAPGADADHARLVAALRADGAPPTTIVHLWSAGAAIGEADDPAALAHELERGVHALLALARAVTAAFKRAPLTCWLVSSDGQAVPGRAPGRVVPARAMLWSVGRVLQQEYPRVRCAGLDLDGTAGGATALAALVVDEVLAEPVGELPWVAYAGTARLAARLVDLAEGAAESCEPIRLRDGGVYLITGGLGGLGTTIARHLAGRVRAPRLALVGRRTAAEVPGAAAALRAVAELGGVTMTLAADAGDADALRAAVAEVERRWGRIDGVIHAAGVLRDRLILHSSRDDVDAVLRPKVHGALALAAATRGRAPDFVVLFSSFAALAPPFGQAAHVAANCFLDAFAHWRSARCGGATLAIDWGPWRDIGVVAGADYQRRLGAAGVVPLTVAEGLADFDAALASGCTQVASVRWRTEADHAAPYGERHATRALHAEPASSPEVAQESDDGRLARAAAAARAAVPRLKALYALDRYAAFTPSVDALCLAYARGALASLGWSPVAGTRTSVAALCAQLGVDARFARVVGRLLAMLADDGAVTLSAAEVVVRRAPGDGAEHAALHQELCERWPAFGAELTLLARCGTNLADMLAGRVEPLKVLFGEGGLELLEALYGDSPVARFFNALLATAVRGALPRTGAPAGLRVLEIGAGTGATTAAVLPLLPGDCEYVFTDVSKIFTRHARGKFAGYRALTCRELDVERDPAGQGFAPATYDLVIAANVLHATADLRASVAHARALLRPGGLLVLLEATQEMRWLGMIFGLLDGWRKFDDERRAGDSPLLDVGAWTALLESSGFGGVAAVPDASLLGDEPGQCVLLAALAEEGHARGAAPAAAVADVADVSGTARHDGREVYAAVVAQVARSLSLAAEDVGPRKSFVELGLDSLLAVEVANGLSRLLAVELTAVAIFEYPTPLELADYLTELIGTGAAAAPPGDAQGLPAATTAATTVAASPETVTLQRLLELYEALPLDQQRLVDAAPTSEEADRLVVELSGA